MIKPITQEALREIIPDFERAIREKKAKNVKPAKAVINFRDEKLKGHERPIESVPIDLLRYRKDNGRIASDVMNYEHLNGPLDEKDERAQKLLRDFLHNKHPEMTEILIKSIGHQGQNEPAIITCDGFLINGNRRKMAFEELREANRGNEKYNYMNVVILPGPDDEGGPPTLLEIERLENRYQLQSEGKSEYYGFDRALSIKRKIMLGLSLEEQLRDDPRYAHAGEQELKKAVAVCTFCEVRWIKVHKGSRTIQKHADKIACVPFLDANRLQAFYDLPQSVWQIDPPAYPSLHTTTGERL